MAGGPHAGDSRRSVVDGGDAPPGQDGGPAAAGSAASGGRSGGPARGRSGRAAAPFGGPGAPGECPDAGPRATESATGAGQRTGPDRRAPPGAEPAGLDPPRTGRGGPADRGAGLQGQVWAAGRCGGGSNPVCGRRAAGRMPGSRRTARGEGSWKPGACWCCARRRVFGGRTARRLTAGRIFGEPAIAAPHSSPTRGSRRCDCSISTGPTF
jgi:hypothetical protein